MATCLCCAQAQKRKVNAFLLKEAKICRLYGRLQTAFYSSICKLVLFQVANLLPPLVHTHSRREVAGRKMSQGKKKRKYSEFPPPRHIIPSLRHEVMPGKTILVKKDFIISPRCVIFKLYWWVKQTLNSLYSSQKEREGGGEVQTDERCRQTVSLTVNETQAR